METINLHDSQILAEKLGARIARILERAIDQKGQAILVVSGGSTPKPLFHYLSDTNLDWSKVIVTLADERCVSEKSAQSNARLVKENLLQGKASSAKFIRLHHDEVSLEQSESMANIAMAELPTYDCVILGMGGDGHTASIFPEAIRRDEALDMNLDARALLLDPVTVEPLRITQTAKRLLDAELIVLHITGDEKAELLSQIMATPNPQKWPIAFFLNQTRTAVSVYQSHSVSPEQSQENS